MLTTDCDLLVCDAVLLAVWYVISDVSVDRGLPILKINDFLGPTILRNVVNHVTNDTSRPRIPESYATPL